MLLSPRKTGGSSTNTWVSPTKVGEATNPQKERDLTGQAISLKHLSLRLKQAYFIKKMSANPRTGSGELKMVSG
jgi:hypothetical protein